MQIEDNQNDDFHRTDLEGGDAPEGDDMMAAPEEDAMMEEPKDDDYMGEEKAMSANSSGMGYDGMGRGYDDGRSEATREAKTKLEQWSLYTEGDDGLLQTEKDYHKRQYSKYKRAQYVAPFICPCIFFGMWGYLCYYFGTDTLESSGNVYTQRHMKMNTGFFFTISATTFFVPFMMRLYSYGKFENNVLRWIIEPFLFTFRLAALVAFSYFIVFQRLIMDYIVGAFFILRGNWWKNKTDPWVTNASYLNAFWAWPTWFWFLYLIVICCIAVKEVCSSPTFRKKTCKFLLQLPIWLWCYLRGMSEYQFEKPFDMLSKTCPKCRKGFTLQDRVITMDCEYNHIYHLKCLAKVVMEAEERTPEGATIECEYKGCDFKKCSDEADKPAEAEGPEGAEAPAEAEGAEAPAEAEGAEAPTEAEGAEAPAEAEGTEAPAEAEGAEAPAEAEGAEAPAEAEGAEAPAE